MVVKWKKLTLNFNSINSSNKLANFTTQCLLVISKLKVLLSNVFIKNEIIPDLLSN